MAAVLLTGMSGTGKSTALAELARLGYPVVDTDHGGYSVEVGSPPEQLWVEDRIDELLSRHRDGESVLFLSGTVANQGRFHDRLDAVVLLSAPVDVVLTRLATRATNPFGRTAADRARVLADLAAVEPLLRASCDAEIDTSRPLPEVVARLVELAERLADGPPCS